MSDCPRYNKGWYPAFILPDCSCTFYLPSPGLYNFLLTFTLLALGQFYNFKCHPNPNENTKCQYPHPGNLSDISNNALNKFLNRRASLKVVSLFVKIQPRQLLFHIAFYSVSEIKSYWLRSFSHRSIFAATYHIAKGLEPD